MGVEKGDLCVAWMGATYVESGELKFATLKSLLLKSVSMSLTVDDALEMLTVSLCLNTFQEETLQFIFCC